jgi:hypothetical protein
VGRRGDRDGRWEGEESLSILRDRKSEFEKMTVFVIIHFYESPVRGHTSTSPIIFRNRHLILSSLPQSSIDTNVKPSQKLISLINSTLLSVVQFQFFEDLSSIMLSEEVLHYLLPSGSTF